MKKTILGLVAMAFAIGSANAGMIGCTELKDKFARFNPKPFLYPKGKTTSVKKLKEGTEEYDLRQEQLRSAILNQFAAPLSSEDRAEMAKIRKMTFEELDEAGEGAYFGKAKLGTQVFDFVNIAAGDTPIQMYYFTGTLAWTGVSFEDQGNLYSKHKLCHDVEFPLNDE